MIVEGFDGALNLRVNGSLLHWKVIGAALSILNPAQREVISEMLKKDKFPVNSDDVHVYIRAAELAIEPYLKAYKGLADVEGETARLLEPKKDWKN